MKKILSLVLVSMLLLSSIPAYATEFIMGDMDFTKYYPYKEFWLGEPDTGFWGTAGIADKGYSYDWFINSAWGMAVAADEYTRQKYGDYDDLNEELLKIWEMRGVKKILHEGEDEARKWSVFVPLSAYQEANADKKYPVVFNFHGYGVTIMLAETYGYAELGGTKDFITVCPTDSAMVPEIMEVLRAEYPIDETRVYATGFSMGGLATINSVLQYPEIFAGAAPTGASLSGFRGQIGTDEQWANIANYGMPICNFCGSADYIRQYPLNANTAISYQKWLDINGIDFDAIIDGYDYASSTDYLEHNVHASFMSSYTKPYQSDFYFGQYQNQDGVTVVQVVLMDRAPHVTNGSIAEIGWEFMSHWSRDPETKQLIYTK